MQTYSSQYNSNYHQDNFHSSQQPQNTYSTSVYYPGSSTQQQVQQDVKQYQQKYGNQNNDWQEHFDPESVFDSDDDEMSLDEIDNNMKRKKKDYKNEYYEEKRKNAPPTQQQQQYQQQQQQYQQTQYLQQQQPQQQQQQSFEQGQRPTQPTMQNFNRNPSSYQDQQNGQGGIDFHIEYQNSDNEQYGFRNINLPEKNYPQVMPLLLYNQNADKFGPRFEFNLQVLELLERYEGKYQLVTIVGQRSSHKHEFLNEIIQDKSGFQANQEGIWIYTQPLINEEEQIYTFFLQCMDLPDDPNANPKMHDECRRYLSFSIMISSQIMFISDAGLNTQTLNNMGFLTQVCNMIHIDGNENQKMNTYWESDVTIQQYLPGLTVIFKDFPLQDNNIDLSHELEAILAVQQREHKVDITKEFIKKFSDREAFGISRSDSRNHMQEMNALINKMKYKVTFKEFYGQKFNARMIQNLLAYCTNQLNQKNCRFSYDQAWNYTVKNECIHGYNKCLGIFHQELQNYFKDDQARTFVELYKILKYIREVTVYEFHQIAGIREKNEFFYRYKMDMMQKIDMVEHEIFKKNDDLAVQKNKEILTELVQPMKQKLASENQGYEFQKLEKFFTDFETFMGNYENKAVGTNKAECFIEFMMEFHPQLIDKMVQQIQQQYKHIEDEEHDKTEEELQQIEAEIPLIEQRIEQYEVQCQDLEQEQVKLVKEKDQLQETLNKCKNENQVQDQMEQQLQQLQQKRDQQQQEIQDIERQLKSLEKPKKGCCGCFG